ncbi:hypothetical protein J6590_057905 [Homalodisca vitripennis]|nr:hypothetical protein J6590_057905 [Homalodisca vitripennis]
MNISLYLCLGPVRHDGFAGNTETLLSTTPVMAVTDCYGTTFIPAGLLKVKCRDVFGLDRAPSDLKALAVLNKKKPTPLLKWHGRDRAKHLYSCCMYHGISAEGNLKFPNLTPPEYPQSRNREEILKK